VQTIFGVYTRIMMLSSALLAGWITEQYDPFTGMNFASIHYATALVGTLVIIKVHRFREEVFTRSA